MKIKNKVIVTTLGIVILVISTIWGLNYLENKEKLRSREIETVRLIEENDTLKKDVESLREQNQLLIRVLEIKQRTDK